MPFHFSYAFSLTSEKAFSLFFRKGTPIALIGLLDDETIFFDLDYFPFGISLFLSSKIYSTFPLLNLKTMI